MGQKSVVVGSNHINTLGLIRSLGEAGIEVIALITPNGKNWAAKSKYISECYYPECEEESIIKILIDIGKREKEKIYLFSTGDKYCVIIDNNLDILIKYYITSSFPEGQGALNKQISKALMQDIAIRAGFSPIKTVVCSLDNSGNDICRIIESFKDCYPILIRADQMDDKTVFCICKSEGEVISFFEREKENKGTVIVQQYIEKDEELDIQGVAWGGIREPAICGVIHKIRTSTIAQGTTTYAELKQENSPIVKFVENYINETGFSGIFDIDVIRKDENYYFVECNYRNGANGYAYTRWGVNLPYIWIIGHHDSSHPRSPIRIMNEFSDYRHVMAKNISIIQWIKELLTAEVHLTINRKDWKPALFRI